MTRRSMIMNAATELRWYIVNKWGDSEAKPEAQRLIDEIVGYPGPAATVGTGSAALGPEGPVCRLAVMVGHNASQPGADAKSPIGTNEYAWNNLVAAEMVRLGASFGIQVKAYNRAKRASYAEEIDDAYAPVNAWRPDACLELHFNSIDGGASGTETLVGTTSVQGGKLAAAVQKAMVSALGLPDRGVKKTPRGERGSRSLYAPEAPAVLVEPFFGSSGRDCAAAGKLGTDGMARMYLEGVRAWWRDKR